MNALEPSFVIAFSFSPAPLLYFEEKNLRQKFNILFSFIRTKQENKAINLRVLQHFFPSQPYFNLATLVLNVYVHPEIGI